MSKYHFINFIFIEHYTTFGGPSLQQKFRAPRWTSFLSLLKTSTNSNWLENYYFLTEHSKDVIHQIGVAPPSSMWSPHNCMAEKAFEASRGGILGALNNYYLCRSIFFHEYLPIFPSLTSSFFFFFVRESIMGYFKDLNHEYISWKNL